MFTLVSGLALLAMLGVPVLAVLWLLSRGKLGERYPKMGKTAKWGAITCGVFFLGYGIVGGGMHTTSTSGSEEPKSEKPAPTKIDYTIVTSWNPPVGKGMAIVVPPSLKQEAKLVAFAKQLQEEYNDQQFVLVQIFDDQKAAELRNKVTSGGASKAEFKFYDSHNIGTYTKNNHTGNHEISIHPRGLNDPEQKSIDLK